MEEEKISIIVPVYNVEKYLEKCIDSLIEQTYKNLEILLIDDGSKDMSSIICDKYEKKDQRIKVIHKDNGGVSSARNRGIEIASGQWITFMDPDDWAEKNMIELALDIAKKYNADIVQWNSYYNKEKEETKRKSINPDILVRKEKEIELFQLDIISTIYEETENHTSVGPIRGVWGKLYKKEVLEGVKFNTKLYAFEDGLFNLNVFNKAKTVVLFNKYLHHYRINPKSVCNSYKSTWLEQNEQILKEVQQFIKENKKEELKFYELYNVLACELFSSSLTRCIFHKNNPKTEKEKKQQLKNYVQTDINKNVFEKVNQKYLNKKQKLIINLVKKQRFNSIFWIYKIKQKLKL